MSPLAQLRGARALGFAGLFGTATALGQLSVDLRTGANQWGYPAPVLAVYQEWSGQAFEAETCVRFPTNGVPGWLPRESWFGFYVHDSARGHRYCLGLFNPTWNPSPPAVPLGGPRHEAFGDWQVTASESHAVPRDAGKAHLRLRFDPAGPEGENARLVLSFSLDGRAWTEAWDYAAPRDLAPDQVGLTVDSYHPGQSFGPTVFESFRIAGDGPAVPDDFDGGVNRRAWQIAAGDRGAVRLPVRLETALDPGASGFVFDRGTDAEIGLRLKTSLLAGQTVTLSLNVSDGAGAPVHSERRGLVLGGEDTAAAFAVPAAMLARNGVYAASGDVRLGEDVLGEWALQFGVIEPRPAPDDVDAASPYMLCFVSRCDVARRIGVRWSRATWFGWDCPRGADGAYDFRHSLDRLFAGSEANRILQVGPICGPTIADERPESIAAYVEAHVAWVRQARERYGPLIRMVEIGNEPENWPVAPPAHEWTLMARAQAEIARALRESVPGVKAMSAGTTHVNLAFLGQLAALGGRDAADAIAVHGYRSPAPPEFGHEDDMRAIRRLFPDTPVWCTEQAYMAWPPDRRPTFDRPEVQPNEVHELVQAAYLPRIFLCQLAAGYAGVSWFQETDETHGLYHSPTHVRPALCAYAALTRLLPHPRFGKRLTADHDELQALQFNSDGATLTALWSVGGRLAVALPAAGVEGVRDLYGNPVSPSLRGDRVVLSVGQAPHYVLGPLSGIAGRGPAPADGPAPWPLLPEEQPPAEPVLLALRPDVEDLRTSRVAVRVRNPTAGPVEGAVSLRFNETLCDSPAPDSWELAPAGDGRFSLGPGAEASVVFQVRARDADTPFDPYRPGPGFFANWWATGYFLAARATLADGRVVDHVARTGLCLRGAPKLPGAQVDGELDEWGAVPVFGQMGADTRHAGHQRFWSGEADYRPEFRLAWSDAGLLFAAEVVDDIHHQVHTGRDLWQGDSVELAINPDPESPSVIDYHLFAIASSPEGPQCFRRRTTPHATAGPVAGATLTVKRIEPDYHQPGVTRYEILIPWAELAPFQPGLRARLGFAVQFNESDGWGRIGWEGWFLTMGGHLANPRGFGDLTLVP